MSRRLRALVLLLVSGGALVLVTGAPASAHASLVTTDPVDGSVVARTPSTVTFTFDEPVRVHDVHGFDPTGADWALDAQAQDNRVVVTPRADPGRGTVVVAWSVVSSDGHVVGGALTFSVGAPGGTAATASAPTSVVVLRAVAAAVAGLGLLIAVGLTLLGRRADLPWNVGLGAALLLAPLHQLADAGRGLGGLTDWTVWLDGLARWPSALLLAAYAGTAVLRTAGRRAAYALVLPVGALLVGAVATWPAPAEAPAAAAAPGGPARGSAALGEAGSVTVTATRGRGRSVQLDLGVVDAAGRPLAPYAVPTLTLRQGEVSLGDAALTETGAGTYRAELTVPTAGTWRASVSVRTSEFDNPVAVVTLDL